MAYLYHEIKQSLTTVSGEYATEDGNTNIYLALMKKWLGNLFDIIQKQMITLHSKYPMYPFYQFVNADAKADDFAYSPQNCLLKPFENSQTRVYNTDFIYDFKIGTFIRVTSDGNRIDNNDTSAPYKDIPFLSERFRIKIDVEKTENGMAGVMINDDLTGDIQKTYISSSIPFLSRQTIGKQQRTFTPKAICSGGKGVQSAAGSFAFLITNSAFLMAGSMSEMPYSLFNFIIGGKAFSSDANDMIAFSNGITRIGGNIISDFVYVPSKTGSRKVTDRMIAHDLILRKDSTDYVIPNIYLTDEPIQSNFTQIQGQFLNLNSDRIVSPDPNAGEDVDESGALCLLASPESFPTRNKVLMFR